MVRIDRDVVDTVVTALFRTLRKTDYIGWYLEGRMADALLLVIRVERTSQPIEGKALAILQTTCQVGVILNGSAENRLPSSYPYDEVKQSMKVIGV